MICICGGELKYKQISESRISSNGTKYTMHNLPAWVCDECSEKEFDLRDCTVSALCYAIDNKIFQSDYNDILKQMSQYQDNRISKTVKEMLDNLFK